jgi:hypothetical protein
MSALHPLASRVPHPAPLRHRPPAWLIIVGLFGAPVAWSLQLLVAYVLVGDRCSGSFAGPTADYGFTGWIVAGVGVLAILACVGALLASWRIWRLTREEGPGRHHEALTAGHGRTRFLGLSGIIASLIFLAAAVFELIVPFLVPPCALPFS